MVLKFSVNYKLVRIWKETALFYLWYIPAPKQLPGEVKRYNGAPIRSAGLWSQNVFKK
jgi:hypothetical protein